jgi:hypothetical protein
VRCPQCRNKVLQKSGSRAKLRVDGPVVFTDEGTCLAKCYWCKTEVEVPIQIREGTELDAERFVLQKVSR